MVIWFITTRAGKKGSRRKAHQATPFTVAWNQSENMADTTVTVASRYTTRPQVAWYSFSLGRVEERRRSLGKITQTPQAAWSIVAANVQVPNKLCQVTKWGRSDTFLLATMKPSPVAAAISTRA